MANSEEKSMEVPEQELVPTEEMERTRERRCFVPKTDIYETEEAITLLADLPGVERNQLDINVEDRQLTITGMIKESEAPSEPVYSEYGVGGYTRSFRLGDTIDQSKINASLTDGVLTLVLPKADRLKPRKIEITA